MMRKALLAVAIVAVGCCKDAPTDPKEQKPTATPPPTSAVPARKIKVEASEILSDYESNEVRADGWYRGKRMEVTGKVSEVAKDMSDEIMVVVGTGKPNEVLKLRCMFSERWTSQVAALSRGNVVTVDCRCEGMSIFRVVMSDCSLVTR